MAKSQLEVLYRFEQDKEKAAAEALQHAELDYQQNMERYNSVTQFRLEYMKRLDGLSMQGIDSATYNHYHKFIAKLDYANEQVEKAIRQAKSLAEQKKRAWFAQRKKLQAVEILQKKEKERALIKQNRMEQRMYDEISTQQYIRKHADY